MTKSARNGKIDFLKVLFTIILVFHHSRMLIGPENCWFNGGSFIVEFYFIISGYFMMNTIHKVRRTGPPTSLVRETRGFLLKKIKGFYPEFFVSFVIAFFVTWAFTGENILVLLTTSIHNLFLYDMSGLQVTAINPATWYLSSMLLVMVILYPLIRKYKTVMVGIILPLVILFTLGYLCGNGLSPRNPLEWYHFTYRGNFRALAEISIGVLCYEFVNRYKAVNFTKIGKWALTVIEYVFYAVLVVYMFRYSGTRKDYFFLLLFIVAICITVSQKGIDAAWYNKKIFYYLGNFSLSLYFSHYFYALTLNDVLPEGMTNNEKMVIYWILSLITTVVVFLAGKLWRRYSSAIIGKCKALFIAQSPAA